MVRLWQKQPKLRRPSVCRLDRIDHLSPAKLRTLPEAHVRVRVLAQEFPPRLFEARRYVRRERARDLDPEYMCGGAPQHNLGLAE